MIFPWQKIFRRPLFLLAALLVLAAQNTFAHAPFDSSTRVIITDDAADVLITTGSSLAENFLQPAGLNPRALASGGPHPLPLAMAAAFFDIAADGEPLVPQAADISSDGMEFRFHFHYPLAAVKALRFAPQFLSQLPAPATSALVMTDEAGNLIGSALLNSTKNSVELSLPPERGALFTPSNQTPAVTNMATPPATLETVISAPSSAPTYLGRRAGLVLFFLLLMIGIVCFIRRVTNSGD